MTTNDGILQWLVVVASYLENQLAQFDEVDFEDTVPQSGPGRSYFLSRVNEIKSALAAIHFAQEVVAQRPTNELLENSQYLLDALAEWHKSVKSSAPLC